MSAQLFLQAIQNKWLEEGEINKIHFWLEEVERAKRMHNESLLTRPGAPAWASLIYVGAYSHTTRGKGLISSFEQVLKGARCEISELSEFENSVLNAMWMDLQWQRIGMLLEKINARKSLTHSENPEDFRSSLSDVRLDGIYENQSDKLNIDFQVQRLPFPLEVLDPRIVRIPPGKTNELHKHAHETVFIFMQGSGHVKVDQVRIPVSSGDFVFIPRWCLHQSVNESDGEMVFLAIADFGLTGKSFTGNYLKTARLKSE